MNTKSRGLPHVLHNFGYLVFVALVFILGDNLSAEDDIMLNNIEIFHPSLLGSHNCFFNYKIDKSKAHWCVQAWRKWARC